jgi:hypothetical protein
MTYQEQFMQDRYAQIACQIAHLKQKPVEWMWGTAKALVEADTKREQEKGKVMSDDHLKQMAVKMAKE